MKAEKEHKISPFRIGRSSSRAISSLLIIAYVCASYMMAVHMKNLPKPLNLRTTCGQDNTDKSELPKAGWIPKRHLPLTKQFVALFRWSSLGHQLPDAGAGSSIPIETASLRIS